MSIDLAKWFRRHDALSLAKSRKYKPMIDHLTPIDVYVLRDDNHLHRMIRYKGKLYEPDEVPSE